MSSFRSFTYATPGFWCGWSYPTVAPVYGCGWYPYAPVIWSPPIVYAPAVVAPVFSPVGFVPFPGFAARGGTTTLQIAREPVVHVRQIAARSPDPVRPSTAVARLRAAKLVATGDHHLRAAVADRAKLRSALDAYRRAGQVAADQPDTFLREAIVLTALDRGDDAAAAIERAAAIDRRLADRPAAGSDRLPPDPVFGDRPLGAPTVIAERSAGLLAGIFGQEPMVDGPNWIADRWARRWQDGRGLIAAR